MFLQTAPITCRASQRGGGSTIDIGYKPGDRLVQSIFVNMFWFSFMPFSQVSHRCSSLMQAEELVLVRENKEGDDNFISNSMLVYRTFKLRACDFLYLSRIRSTTTSTKTSATISWRTIWKVPCLLPNICSRDCLTTPPYKMCACFI